MATRQLPHSLEAEANLLSSLMLPDSGAETMAKCLFARISRASFYDAANGLIFEAAHSLYRQAQSVEAATIAEELKKTGSLETAGGYAKILAISDKVPTSAGVSYFIQTVSEAATRREVIRALTATIEECFDGVEVLNVLTEARNRIDRVRTHDTAAIRKFNDFMLAPENDDKSLFGKYRYICRGDSCLIVGGSGTGKSAMNYGWAAYAALGRHWFGIETHMATETLPDGTTRKRGLRSLIIQSEDADDEIGEMRTSLIHALKLTEEEIKLLDNIVVIRDTVSRGDAFLAKLKVWVDRVKPDLVWINPLHAYAGCDITDATEIGKFLREGLNAINIEGKFAYMIVHHTPKPITGKGVPDRKWNEFMYDAAGSAELVNWARAVITIKPVETEYQFNLILAKRGKRAGVAIETESESGVPTWEITCKIPIAHSRETITLPGRSRPFQVIHWVPRDPDAEEAPKPKADQFVKNQEESYSDADLIDSFPARTADGLTFTALQRRATELTGISRARFAVRLKAMTDAELVAKTADGRWRRTERGDNLAKAELEKRK